MLYKVAKYPGVTEQIVALVERATLAGIRQIVVAALKEMVLHLQTHLSHWGDPEYITNVEGGVAFHAVLDPIIELFPLIAAYAKAPSPQIRASVMQSMRHFDQKGVPILAKGLLDEDVEVRDAAARALKWVGPEVMNAAP
jgi:hypothetical protein